MINSTELEQKIKKLEGPIFIFGASGFVGINIFHNIFSVRKDCYAITHDAINAWRLKLLNVPYNNIIHCDITSLISVKNIFEKYKPKTVFIDVYHSMLLADGTAMKNIFLSDSLHMNSKGYAIWKRKIAPYLIK